MISEKELIELNKALYEAEKKALEEAQKLEIEQLKAREQERQDRGRKVLEDEYNSLGGSVHPNWKVETIVERINKKRNEKSN